PSGHALDRRGRTTTCTHERLRRRVEMTVTTSFRVLVVAVALLVGAAAGSERDAAGALPPGNTVEQWDQIAEDTVVGSGVFQNEGYLYMAYESTAVYDAVVAIQGRYQPLDPVLRVSKNASPDAAVVEAAYRTLRHFFPAANASLDPLYAAALSAIADGPAKQAGKRISVVAADAGISVMHAKYHYLFWRPVTAIDPTAVSADGYGSATGYDDGNPATVEQTGWRPLLTTPNHPEYPAAHGSLTGAMADVFSSFLGTSQINLDIHGFDPNGPAGNLNAVQHFNTADDMRTEIVNARTWGGLHYRFSGVAGVLLGHQVATYDLKHAFQPLG